MTACSKSHPSCEVVTPTRNWHGPGEHASAEYPSIRLDLLDHIDVGEPPRTPTSLPGC